MKPVVAIVGCGKCGKTTLIERLIAEFTGRGYAVGTVKHDAHGFSMDREGKDTWRHKQAGAQAVAIVGPGQAALVRSTPAGELSLSEAIALLGPVDLVIAEGFKRELIPKIEVFSSIRNEGSLLCGQDPQLLAVVGDLQVDTKVPVVHWDDIQAIAMLIEAQLL